MPTRHNRTKADFKKEVLAHLWRYLEPDAGLVRGRNPITAYNLTETLRLLDAIAELRMEFERRSIR